MGDLRLCLLLLLSTCVFAQEDAGNAEEESAPCLLAKRFRSFRNYVYQYETEALNGVSGTSNLRNGAKATCRVEIDVPQACSYILRTTECTLSEVSDVSPEGLPVYSPALAADAFQAAMAKHPLKLTVEGESKVSLFPEEDEPTNILNIKRGIVSALLVPVLEEESNRNMATLHGMCKTDYVVNTVEDTATDVSVIRDLSHCDSFSPKKDVASPLALISGLHMPLSKLISSTQTCKYRFDNEMKHMTEGSCTEKHILLPFSHQGKHGVLSIITQTLTLQETDSINDRVFDHNEANLKTLPMEAVEDKSPVQTKDAVLATLTELSTLSQGKSRAHLFQKLVTEMRGLRSEALSAAVPEMMEVSGLLTWQALAQCGTPECSSAILQILRTKDTSALEVDAAVYAMGLLPNPDKRLVKEMLSMAEYKHSKPILYGLSNIVRKVYKIEGKVTPEITAVSEYMATLLGDCSGDKDQTFLALRVIGNMGQAMEAANPALKNALLQCMTQPEAAPIVQQAAIQAFRRLTIDEEARSVLLQTVLDGASPIQKRVAAYLVLMKNPEASDLAQVISALPDEQDPQAKSFVTSHLANILSSTDPESQPMKEKITEALQGNDIPAAFEFSKFSRNYKMSNALEGNVIFDSTGYLPKEVMLETTLKAFGYDLDVMEFGLDGKGLEPTFEALFGPEGFFPDTLSKALYWAGSKMPESVSTLLQKMILPPEGRRRREVPENILREISQNVNKLVMELKSRESPDALVYLKLLGAELGFISTNEMETMAYSAVKFADHLLKKFPMEIKKLMSSTDNELFMHYLLADIEFLLPTASGSPLKVSLSGTIAPGIKGGLHITPQLGEISFMPSVGVEFVMGMGVDVPEFVTSRVTMHTNVYHESGLHAKVAMGDGQIKLTVPAPESPIQLLEISNSLRSVTTTETKTLPPVSEEGHNIVKCIPTLPGLKSCITVKYPIATDAAPYFPLTGESGAVVELLPTGQVTAYTAAISYELLAEGEEAEKVDTLKIALAAEGAEPIEATAVVKLNRNTHDLTTDVHIPDLDISGGIRLGISDDSTNGQAIMIDITHKKIPRVSLIGRAKLEAMRDGMLQVQLSIPSLKTDATASVALKRAGDLTLELESVINIPETSSSQKITVKYRHNHIEVGLKTDLGTEAHKLLLHHINEYQKVIEDILDLTVTQADMTVRQIMSKSVEATNMWLDSTVADAPAPIIEILRQIPDLHLPEKLFFHWESGVAFSLVDQYFTIPIPLPLGGKSSEDIGLPQTVTTPHLAVPQINLVIPSKEISIPTFSIPHVYELPVSLPDLALQTKISSNLYDWEGLAWISVPSNFAKYKVVGDCPLEILSYKTEGIGKLSTTADYFSSATLSFSLNHKLIDANINLEGAGKIADKVNIRTSSKIQASSPLGLETSLQYETQSTLATDELVGEGNLDGTIKISSLYANATGSQSYAIYPLAREMRGESILGVDSSIFQANNRIKGTFANGEVSIISSTNMYNDILKHLAEIKFKDARLSVKSDGMSGLLGGTLRNQIEIAAAMDSASIRVETHGDYTSNRAFSLLSGSLSASGLEMNTEGSLNFEDGRGSQKATLTYKNHSLAISGTTTLHSDPLSFENDFTGGIDEAGTTLSVITKGSILDIKFENKNTLALTLSTLAFHSQTDNDFSPFGSYQQHITVDVKPFLASIKSSTTGKILKAHIIQSTDLDIAGLSSKFNNELQLNTRKFHLDSTLRTVAAPFSLSVDSLFNSEGQLTLFGKHTGEIHTKHLLKAEPLSVAFTHGSRVSTSHQLDVEDPLVTYFDNKIDSLLTPQEQRGTWRMTSKLNNHAYNQEISIYNQPERIGVELSGVVLTNLLNMAENENQEFSISSFLKYDKNSDRHVLSLPFFETIPALFEQIKTSSITVLETMKQYINSEEIRARLENFPESVNEFIRDQDLESKLTEVKEKCITLLQEYSVTQENFEAFFESIKAAIETIFNEVGTRVKGMLAVIKETIENGVQAEAISDVVVAVVRELHAINEKFEIHANIISIIAAIEDVIGKVDLEMMQDSSLAWVQELDLNYGIRAKLLDKVTELKQVIESFDLELFIQDLKNFVSSFVARYNEHLESLLSTETIIGLVDFIKQGMGLNAFIEELRITERIDVVYTKVKDFIVEYEVEKKTEILLEKIVELIRQFQIEATTQTVINSMKDADLPVLYDKAMKLLDDTVNHVKTLDFNQIIDLLNDYIDSTVKKLKSFDYNGFVDEVNTKISEITSFVNEKIKAYQIQQKLEAVQKCISWIQTSLFAFEITGYSLPEIRIPEVLFPKPRLENFNITTLEIPEFTLPSISSQISIPTFGKLHGDISLKSPHFSVRTSAELQNSTTNSMTPQLTAYMTSKATSTADILNYVLDVTGRVGFPKMSRVTVSETVTFTHKAVSVEHQGSISIYGLSAQASAKTITRATTALYNAELINNAFFALESGFSASLDTYYNHSLSLDLLRIKSEATMTQKAVSRLESGTMHLTIGTTGTEKWSAKRYTDELTHQSELEFTLTTHSAKLTFTGNTDSQYLIMKQTLNADAILLKSITIDGRAETDAPFIKSSLMLVRGKADMGDLKIELKASHDTELEGSLSGTISNAVNLHANPSEIIIDVQNKGNAKAALPFSMSGKIDQQNDFTITLNTEVQQINWVVLSRFNQYKYFHNLTLDNNQKETVILATMNGEANLNILTFPLDIPGITLPLIGVQTPALHEVTLWENTGLKALLTTTEQNIDINLKLQHEKSPKAFTTGIDTITIPTLGNLIIDLSMKSPVLSLNANAHLQNQEDFVAQLEGTSTSPFDILKSKFDGTMSLSRKKRGIRIVTAVSMAQQNIEGTHHSTINLQRRAIEASVATVAKVSLPILNLEINQELIGSTKGKASLDSKTKLRCGFNIPLIDVIGKGDFEQTLAFDLLSGHMYLDTFNKGNVEGTVLESGKFVGALDNEANIHVDANGLRSSLKTDVKSSGNFGESKDWNMDLIEHLAFEVSSNGLDVGLNLISSNEVNVDSFNTKGKYSAKGLIELGPQAKVSAKLDIDMSQPSSLGVASILENIALEISAEEQKLSMTGKEQLASVLHTSDWLLSNDATEIRLAISESVDGHAAVLKAVKLPIYEKNLWDVLKFDEVTNEDDLQSIKGEIVAVSRKDLEGYIPAALSTTVKVTSPVYSTTVTGSLEKHTPTYTASLKSTCTSPLAFLAYDLDFTGMASINGGILSLNNKGTFDHIDLKMELQHALSRLLSKEQKNSSDVSPVRHTLNVDITSPTFSDMNFRYASGKDRISTTISAPTSGFLGLQLSRSSARIYARYPSEPESDVQILIFKKGQAALDKDAVNDILLGLKSRVPDITATVYNAVDKYHRTLFDKDIKSTSNEFKVTVSKTLKYLAKTFRNFQGMNEFARLYRNLLDLFEDMMKMAVGTMTKFLRELKFHVPVNEEKLTLPELSRKIMSAVATAMDRFVQRLNDFLEPTADAAINFFSNIQVAMPGSDEEVPASEVLENLKSAAKELQRVTVDMVRRLESPDVMLQTIADFVQGCARKTEELVAQAFKSDRLDAVASHLNSAIPDVLDLVNFMFRIFYVNMDLKEVNHSLQHLIDVIRTPFHMNIGASTDAAPAAEDVPASVDALISEEVPAVGEELAAEEVSVAEEVPAAEGVPVVEEVSVAEEVPAAEGVPVVEEVSVAEEVPAAEDVDEVSPQNVQ